MSDVRSPSKSIGTTGRTYVNALAAATSRPSRLATVTSTGPAAWAGVRAVISVGLTTTTFVAAWPPIVTVAPATNPVPVMVTFVPPGVTPVVGTITENTGGPV